LVDAAALVRALRPAQWIKNVFVLAALVFAQEMGDPHAVGRALAAFVVFCALSSAVYLVNDIADREADRLHPVKRHRPVASGRVSVPAAGVGALVLAVAGLGGAAALGVPFAAVGCTYVLMNLAYSLALKRIVILDVMLVAAGFLLRAWGGAVVLDVEMSHWLILCTGLIALFLGFVKRRQEITASPAAESTRPILREYSEPFLDQMIAIVTSSTLLAYALYVFSPEVAAKLGTRYMGLTLPFVLFGIFRYLYLVHQRGKGENPTLLVVKDVPLLITVLLWGASILVALYVLHGPP
jgi:4-hydroxybenzoate polyprenyltransferase